MTEDEADKSDLLPGDHPERRPGEVFLDAGNVALPGERLGSLARTTEDGIPLYWTFGSLKAALREARASVRTAQAALKRAQARKDPSPTGGVWLKTVRRNLEFWEGVLADLEALARKDAEAAGKGGEDHG